MNEGSRAGEGTLKRGGSKPANVMEKRKRRTVAPNSANSVQRPGGAQGITFYGD